MFNSFGLNLGRHPARSNQVDQYSQSFSALPSAFSETHHERLDGGARVLLPASCLDVLAKLNVAYPLQFEIKARKTGLRVWAGVLEFVAPEGQVILPRWMFMQLGIEPRETVQVRTAQLRQGVLVKLQPHQRAFVEGISDPRRILEQHLQNHPVLTKGSTFDIKYLGREFLIDVLDIKDTSGDSSEAVSTVFHDGRTTELKVEFARPLDMPESPVLKPATPPPAALAGASNVIGGQEGVQFTPLQFRPPSLTAATVVKPNDVAAPQKEFKPFNGSGRTLSGRPPPQPVVVAQPGATPAAGGGTLGRQPPATEACAPSATAFKGPGRTLR